MCGCDYETCIGVCGCGCKHTRETKYAYEAGMRRATEKPKSAAWQCPVCKNVLAPTVTSCPFYHGVTRYGSGSTAKMPIWGGITININGEEYAVAQVEETS